MAKLTQENRSQAIGGIDVLRKRAAAGDEYSKVVIKSYDELPEDKVEEFLEMYCGLLMTAKLTGDIAEDVNRNRSSRVKLGKIVSSLNEREFSNYQDFFEEARKIGEED